MQPLDPMDDLNEEQRARAKQNAMLDIDVEYADEWVATMSALVDRNLGSDEFTDQRMALLKDWERRRKLAQHRLHYQYDPARRSHSLIRRDVAKQLSQAKAQIAGYRSRQAAGKS